MKILIVKLSAIGDVVHSLPALYALREKFPSAHIVWLVEEAASGLLIGHPLLDRVIISKRKTWLNDILKQGMCKKALSEIRSFVRDLRDTEYDIVLDLHALLKSGLLIWLSRSGRKIGYREGDEGSSVFLNERIAPYDLDRHAVLRYMNLAEHIGARPNGYHFPIPVSDTDKNRVNELLKGYEVSGSFIVINPVAKWETKLWDTGKFASLADRCIQELRLPVVFTGSRDDREEVRSMIAQMHEQAIDFCGRTNLGELAYLYSLSSVMITTDTGPMHIGAAVNARVVALFGPTAPWRTGPFGDGHIVIRTNEPCSPCFRKKCPDPKCMSGIKVDVVFEAVKRQLGEQNQTNQTNQTNQINSVGERRTGGNMISKTLLDILACPKCKGDIRLNESKDGLICDKCKLLYEIKDDIPIMLIDEAKKID
ncbi:MAG: glycosyltransferase family 9 protein [Pseudomonadota bacterium]